MDNNERMADERIRDGVKYFSNQMRKLGLIGDTMSNVGEAREAAPDPVVVLNDGQAPMIRTTPQGDR